MINLEPILNVLCNYKAGFVLDAEELLLLRNWLAESPVHEKLFTNLSNRTGMTWVMGEIEGNARERILGLLIEMEETGPE